MPFLRCLIAIVLFLLSFPTFAQKAEVRKDSVKAYGYVRVVITRNGTMTYNDAVDVYLVQGKNILKPVNHDVQNYYFVKVPVGTATAFCESPGFVTASKTVKVARDSTSEVLLSMGDKVVTLKDVVVKGHTPAMVMRGDTIRFNPSAVTIYENDDVRQILEQMPGVEVGEKSVSILGKDVKRTYVNGANTFGSDPMSAVDHVSAKDVVTIKAYEEENDRRKYGGKRGKQMVMDIVTKEPIFNSSDLHALAGVGTNFDNNATNHDTRYFGGGTFNFFSDAWLTEVSLMHNNLSRKSTNQSQFLNINKSQPQSYGEESIARTSFEKTLNPENNDTIKLFGTINGSYDFTRSATDGYNQSSTSYNPTTNFNERTYDNTSFSHSQSNSHRGSVESHLFSNDIGMLYFTYNIYNTHTRNGNNSKVTNTTDGVSSRSLLNTSSRGISRGNDFSVGWQKDFNEHFNVGVDMNLGLSSSDNNELRLNDVDGVQEETGIRAHNKSFNWKVTPSFTYTMSKSSYVRLSNDLTYKRDKVEHSGMDMLTGMRDSINTYAYRSHTWVNLPQLLFKY